MTTLEDLNAVFDGELVHLPIPAVLVPRDHFTVYTDRWWTVYAVGYISIYIGNGRKFLGSYASFAAQCNKNEAIANRRGAKHAIYLPTVFLPMFLQAGEST